MPNKSTMVGMYTLSTHLVCVDISVYHTLPTFTGEGGPGARPPGGQPAKKTFWVLGGEKRPRGAAWPALATRTARDFWLRPSACLPRREAFQDFGLRPSACLPRREDFQDFGLRPSACLHRIEDFQDFGLRPSACLPRIRKSGPGGRREAPR